MGGPIVMVMFKHCHSAGDARRRTHTHTHTRESRPHRRRLVIVRSGGGCRCASCSERRQTTPIPLDAVSETYASSSAPAPCVTSTPSGDNRRGYFSALHGRARASRELYVRFDGRTSPPRSSPPSVWGSYNAIPDGSCLVPSPRSRSPRRLQAAPAARPVCSTVRYSTAQSAGSQSCEAIVASHLSGRNATNM